MPTGFGRFWSGEAISGFGTWVSLLALQTLVVLTLDGGATETGLLSSARWLPYLASAWSSARSWTGGPGAQ